MLGILMDGGWMMLPLVLCSVIAVAIIIDRARAFRAAGSDHEALRKRVVAELGAGNVEAAADACAASQGPVAATVLAGLRRYTSMKAKDKRPEEIEAEKVLEAATKVAAKAPVKPIGMPAAPKPKTPGAKK